MKRLFIAIPVTPAQALLDVIDHLKSALRAEQVNWVAPQNLHFTLQFLGDTGEVQIPAISDQIREVSLQYKKGTGILKGIGFFSQNGNPRVLFTKLEGIPEIPGMAREIQTRMQTLGFTPELREFKPHLTLGRIKYLRNKQGFYKIAESKKDCQIQPFNANEVILYESILRPEGPVYRSLATFELQSV